MKDYDEVYKEIFKKALAGEPTKEIAKEFGYTRGTINKILRNKYGFRVRRLHRIKCLQCGEIAEKTRENAKFCSERCGRFFRDKNGPIESKYDYKSVMLDAVNGSSVNEIMQKYNYSRESVNRILRSCGLPYSAMIEIRNRRIAEHYKKCYDIKAVANHFNLSISRIGYILNKQSISHNKINPNVEKRIIQLYKSGKDITEIGQITGHSQGLIVRLTRGLKHIRICPICDNSFEIKGQRKYCNSCLENKNVIRRGIPIQCAECGRTFKQYYNRQNIKYCTRYCYNLNRKRQTLILKQQIYHDVLSGEDNISICLKYNISASYFKQLSYNNRYLDIPPLYWSSDDMMLKHNSWSTPETRIRLILRAKRECKAFQEWETNRKASNERRKLYETNQF